MYFFLKNSKKIFLKYRFCSHYFTSSCPTNVTKLSFNDLIHQSVNLTLLTSHRSVLKKKQPTLQSKGYLRSNGS